MVAAYPALSGFITDPRKTLDLIFSSYLLSDASQSNTFQGVVISLPKRIQLFNGNPDIFVEDVRTDLLSCLSRYFDQSNVQVNYKDIDETPDHTLHIYIGATVARDNITYDLARTISITDSKTFKVIDTLNQ